jgi:hypothetical protein
MLLKHSRDEKKKLLAIEFFLIEKLRTLELLHENEFISTVFYYLHNSTHLTSEEIVIIFTKVSTIVNNIAMTATEQLREETTLNHIRGLIQNGVSMELISKSFGLSIQKIEEMITKLKNSNT